MSHRKAETTKKHSAGKPTLFKTSNQGKGESALGTKNVKPKKTAYAATYPHAKTLSRISISFTTVGRALIPFVNFS